MIADSIFKAYDIRGIYPEELNEDVAYAIAQAYTKLFAPKVIALGRDVRISGASLWSATAKGFTDHGVDIVDIGVITTDTMSFTSGAYDYDGAIIISASHNPREYNGMKMMRRGAIAVSGDTGIQDIQKIVQSGYAWKAERQGAISRRNVGPDYLTKCLSFIDVKKLKPLTAVLNGMFGPVVNNVRALGLPLTIVPLNDIPDGTFPKGAPNPFLPENQKETRELIEKTKPDLGAAWDGDADRFFIYDETGRAISGYFLTAFLGAYFAKKYPGAKIVHDPRLTWAVQESVIEAGGVPLVNRVGHSFIKTRMREEDAIFGGEMSGHFYFRDFYYADNGLIPFLLLLEVISETGKKVSELFEPYFSTYAILDGELNTPLAQGMAPDAVLEKIKSKFSDADISLLDGISIEYNDWRANIRASNTEPLLRLNVEARSHEVLLVKTKELQDIIAEG